MSGTIACRVCDARSWGERLEARERQFGLPGTFTYASCSACESMQLLDPPADLAPYYPVEYYSLGPQGSGGTSGRLKAEASRYLLTGRGALGAVLARLRRPLVPTMAHWLARVRATPAPTGRTYDL